MSGKLQAFLATTLLLVLVACSPGGAPSGGPVAANYAGYWVWTDGVSLFNDSSFFKLNQSGSRVTGQWYVTYNLTYLRYADSVSKCGALSGNVRGKTLTLRVDLTSQNCPELDINGGFTATGQLKDDMFVGSYVGDGGGVGRKDSVIWENVPADDPRVDFNID